MVATGLGGAVLPSIAAAAIPAGVAVLEVEDPEHSKRSALTLHPAEPTGAARAVVAALRTEAARIAMSTTALDRAGEQGTG